MHIWPMAPEQLSSDLKAPDGERRDVVLWDLGGQDEYRLVHQLFLHDTTLALVLLDPTRGRAAFNEVEEWNKRLEKQLQGRKAVKILVGTKLDHESRIVNRPALMRLTRELGFSGYYATSAKKPRGISELRIAMAKALDWQGMAKTKRPELFQIIRDEIDRKIASGEVVLYGSDLESQVRRLDPKNFNSGAVASVVRQLALQGVITEVQLSTGESVLVLQIVEVERYAGALIVAARNNRRGVPALEEALIGTSKVPLAGINPNERLRRSQEKIVLQCVVQLMLEHGICLKHQGMLLFPSLFTPTERGDSRSFPHSISLYSVVSLKNSTINEQTHTISKPLNLLDSGHLPSGSYRGV